MRQYVKQRVKQVLEGIVTNGEQQIMDEFDKNTIEQSLDILACPVSKEKLLLDADV